MDRFYRRHLPHYRLDGAGVIYFVTWRLAAAQPPLTEVERDWVMAAVRHWHGLRCTLSACVVMDDHVHVMLSLYDGVELERLLQSWKGFSAHRLVRESARRGTVWQHESYDHVIRNDAEFRELADYIECNPRKRWRECAGYRWLWTAWEMS